VEAIQGHMSVPTGHVKKDVVGHAQTAIHVSQNTPSVMLEDAPTVETVTGITSPRPRRSNKGARSKNITAERWVDRSGDAGDGRSEP